MGLHHRNTEVLNRHRPPLQPQMRPALRFFFIPIPVTVLLHPIRYIREKRNEHPQVLLVWKITC